MGAGAAPRRGGLEKLALIIHTKSGLAESSVRHFRDLLSSLSGWTVRELMIAPAMAMAGRPRAANLKAGAGGGMPQPATPKTPSRPNAVHQCVDQVGLRQLR